MRDIPMLMRDLRVWQKLWGEGGGGPKAEDICFCARVSVCVCVCVCVCGMPVSTEILPVMQFFRNFCLHNVHTHTGVHAHTLRIHV